MTITLYHGSDVEVKSPAIRTANRALDFGCGFYTTLNLDQARAFANKVCERNRTRTPIVSVYTIDFEVLKANVSVLSFDAPDEPWLDFVSDNRNGVLVDDRFDAVFGPVANDSVFKTFIAYQNGTLTKAETIARLKVRPLYNQLTFKTVQSLSYLHFERSLVVDGGES